MSSIEKRFADFIEKNLHWLLLCCAVLFGLLIRFSLHTVSSLDMTGDYIPWAEELSGMTLTEALRTPVGNYSSVYQLVLFFLTRLPFLSIPSKIKAVSCFFDLLLAISAGFMIYKESRDTRKGILLFGLCFLSPIVFLNSAAWGQCDSIYTFFALWAVWFLYKRKPLFAFLFLGISFSWKLQAVFVLPIFLYMYLRRKDFSLLYFLVVPAVMVLLYLPNLIAGRPLKNLFGVYSSQVGIFSESIYINFSNFFALFVADRGAATLGSFSSYGSVLLTFMVLGLLLFLFLKEKKDNSLRNTVFITFLFAFTCVMFLPKMHDRYGYICELLALFLCVYDRKLIVPTVLLFAQSLFHYGLCLCAYEAMPLWVATALFIGSYALYLRAFFRKPPFREKDNRKNEKKRL